MAVEWQGKSETFGSAASTVVPLPTGSAVGHTLYIHLYVRTTAAQTVGITGHAPTTRGTISSGVARHIIVTVPVSATMVANGNFTLTWTTSTVFLYSCQLLSGADNDNLVPAGGSVFVVDTQPGLIQQEAGGLNMVSLQTQLVLAETSLSITGGNVVRRWNFNNNGRSTSGGTITGATDPALTTGSAPQYNWSSSAGSNYQFSAVSIRPAPSTPPPGGAGFPWKGNAPGRPWVGLGSDTFKGLAA